MMGIDIMRSEMVKFMKMIMNMGMVEEEGL